MKGKIFSPAEATRMLPLVSRIIANAKASARLLDRHERVLSAIVARGTDTDARALARRADLMQKIRRLQEHVRALQIELENLGWFIVSARDGIAKCYAERDARIVYLTWTLGEPRVSFWFPLKASHLDRQPLEGASAREAGAH